MSRKSKKVKVDPAKEREELRKKRQHRAKTKKRSR